MMKLNSIVLAAILFICFLCLIQAKSTIDHEDNLVVANGGGGGGEVAGKNRYEEEVKRFIAYLRTVAERADEEAESNEQQFDRLSRSDAVGFWKRLAPKLGKARKFWKRFNDENASQE